VGIGEEGIGQVEKLVPLATVGEFGTCELKSHVTAILKSSLPPPKKSVLG